MQYAHARIAQLIDKAAAAGITCTGDAALPWTRLGAAHELTLMRALAAFPRLLLGATLAREPHRLPTYLQELATAFHGFYHNHRVVTEDAELSRARLALACATQIVLRRGLELMGVSAPDSM